MTRPTKQSDSAGRTGSNSDQAYGRKRMLLPVGIAASLLIHALAFWLLLRTQDPLLLNMPGTKEPDRITVNILAPSPQVAPPATAQTSPPIPAPSPRLAQVAPPTPVKKPAAVDRKRSSKSEKSERSQDTQVAGRTQKPAENRMTVPDQTRAAPAAPTDDFLASLEAARRRRAEAAGSTGDPSDTTDPAEPPQQAASKNDNSVAMANIEFSMKQSRKGQRDDVGGVFRLDYLGSHNAELLFFGWSENRRRNATREVRVEQGSNPDIQTALVRKVIDIIREEKKEDFVWESRRLGKPITLSARPQDSKELERFLLREFFPDYVPVS